jgi:beta-lactamase class A
MNRRTFLKQIALAGATLCGAREALAMPGRTGPAALQAGGAHAPLIPPPAPSPLLRAHTAGAHATDLARRWALDDAPVANGNLERAWHWGTQVLSSGDEPYAEAPNGKRAVWYFDKGSLEWTEPTGDPADVQPVSPGPLVYELISGLIKVGDSAVVPYLPAMLPVAGDDVPAAQTITYAELRRHISLTSDRRSPPRDGATIIEHIRKGDTVVQDERLAPYGVRLRRYDDVTGHNVAAVFDDAFEPEQLTRLAGHPLAEPFWISVPVKGQPTDVLIQTFERRVMTYTPSNPNGAQVEWGNVGRHYAQWRHGSAANGAPFDPRSVLEIVANAPLSDLAPGAQNVVAGRPEKVGAAVFDLRNGTLYSAEGTRSFPMYSTVKAAVMLTLLDQAMRAKRGVTAEEDRLIRPMIQVSDNAATSALLRRVGGAAAVMQFLRGIGVENTRIRDGSWGLSTTTAPDMVRMLGRLANGTILNRELRAYAFNMMRSVVPEQRWGVSAGVPPEGSVAIKNGWYPASGGWAINSIGIVKGGGKLYAIAVYTTANPSMRSGISTIEAVGRDVYTALA